MIYTDGLHTPRLVTRFLTLADALAWTAFFNSDIATAYIPIDPAIPLSDKSAWWIGRQLNRYKEGSLGMQALISKETGELVGMCGLLVQEVNGQREIEVGYHLLPVHWHKGMLPKLHKRFATTDLKIISQILLCPSFTP